ncbi:YppE family protein [Bacillus spongiae]|uniref:YppE family protein n=1 Tax=Bacillus spongiae TaxID=2683610 RepID=A0ABU8HDL7_9BACI
MNNLLQLTEELIHYNEELKEIYDSKRASGDKGDFYNEVKPYADKVRDVLNKWEQASLEWIKKAQPKYIHRMQIQQTLDNVELVSVQAFYPETSYNRFQSYHQSIHYNLQTIKNELTKSV